MCTSLGQIGKYILTSLKITAPSLSTVAFSIVPDTESVRPKMYANEATDIIRAQIRNKIRNTKEIQSSPLGKAVMASFVRDNIKNTITHESTETPKVEMRIQNRFISDTRNLMLLYYLRLQLQIGELVCHVALSSPEIESDTQYKAG